MKPKTRVLHARVDVKGAKPNVTPLFQASSYLADSEYLYARKGHPNASELELALRELEGAKHVLAVTTGMTAIHLALGLLRPGDHLLVNRLIYGCSYKLFQDFCGHYGIGLDFADLSDPKEAFERARPKTRMAFFETPTNPFLETVPISAVASAVRRKAPGALVVVDNTWATPYFQRPLALGADLCVYSATKFYSGHSDCMGGLLSTDDGALAERLAALRFHAGAILDPHSAWLLRRSLQTFALRMEEHQRALAEMAAFLGDQPEVAGVYLPRVDPEQLRGYGGILFLELKPGLAPRASSLVRSLTLFERGTSMACVVSSVAQPFSGSHLSLTEREKSDMGIRPGLVRLCFGLEDREDLKADLQSALRGLSRTSSARAAALK